MPPTLRKRTRPSNLEDSTTPPSKSLRKTKETLPSKQSNKRIRPEEDLDNGQPTKKPKLHENAQPPKKALQTKRSDDRAVIESQIDRLETPVTEIAEAPRRKRSRYNDDDHLARSPKRAKRSRNDKVVLDDDGKSANVDTKENANGNSDSVAREEEPKTSAELPGFLKIPAEIRRTIYKMLMEIPDDVIHLDHINHPTNSSASKKVAIVSHKSQAHKPDLSIQLLFVCRKVYNEAVAFIYGENTIHCKTAGVLLTFLRTVGSNKELIQSVCPGQELQADRTYWCYLELQRCPKLKHLKMVLNSFRILLEKAKAENHPVIALRGLESVTFEHRYPEKIAPLTKVQYDKYAIYERDVRDAVTQPAASAST